MAIDGDGAGLYTLDYQGQAGAPSSVMLAGVREPHPWSELEDFLDTSTSPGHHRARLGHPGRQRQRRGRDRQLVTTTVELPPGTVGPICGSGAWPDITFVAGEPVDLGG